LLEGNFDLDDFLKQLQQIKKIGPLGQLLELVPGLNKLSKNISMEEAEKQMNRTEAIISSMTFKERRNPRLFNASRKRRVATGSSNSVQDVNQLLSQFRQMQKMMKELRNPRKLKNFMNMFDGLR
jgi:signal recognition particle subunit SRP54